MGDGLVTGPVTVTVPVTGRIVTEGPVAKPGETTVTVTVMMIFFKFELEP